MNLRRRRPEEYPEPLWFHRFVPEPERPHRWRIRLSCGCIREVLTRGSGDQLYEAFYDPISRRYLPRGQVACCSDQTEAIHPYHFQQIVGWGARRERTYPADPVEAPDYLADLDTEHDLWAELRNAEPVTRAVWDVELACGHFGETSAPSLDWQPGDGPQTVSNERAAAMTAKWEELYATTPTSLYDNDEARAHRLRMLALGWPNPQPELDCWTCSYARKIEVIEYVGPLTGPRRPAPVDAARPRSTSNPV